MRPKVAAIHRALVAVFVCGLAVEKPLCAKPSADHRARNSSHLPSKSAIADHAVLRRKLLLGNATPPRSPHQGTAPARLPWLAAMACLVDGDVEMQVGVALIR
jgi:hypothetical protein